MGEMITKPDANPILLAVLNGLIMGIPIGYFMIGQQKKAIISWVIAWVLWPMCGLGLVWVLVIMYDSYLLGQKLAQGESITQMENGVAFLDKIFKD